MTRIIFHVDMDAFFVSVEIRKNPKLKNRPVVVGADPKEGKGRGVVSTCSYKARKYGIHSGMPISQAYKLCPDAKFLPVHMGFYKETSRRIMNILKKYANKMQQISVDEAFLDMSDKVSGFDEAKQMAKKIKREIKNEEKLTCSIGMGPNKLIAKIASDFEKPDGLTIVKPEGVKKFLFPLPVKKLYGVGPKAEEKLRDMGIETVEELAEYDKQGLVNKFGKWGLQMHLHANGIDKSPVTEKQTTKSIGRECTFERDSNNKKEIYSILDKIAEQVYHDIKNQRFSFKTLVIKVRYSNFDTHTKQTTLDNYRKDLKTIKSAAKNLMKNFLNKRKIRLLGIRVTKLKKTSNSKARTLKDF